MGSTGTQTRVKSSVFVVNSGFGGASDNRSDVAAARTVVFSSEAGLTLSRAKRAESVCRVGVVCVVSVGTELQTRVIGEVNWGYEVDE